MRKCLLVLIALLTVVRAGDASSFDNDMLNSKLAINGNMVPYPIFSIFVMPNKTFTVEFDNKSHTGNFQFHQANGEALKTSSNLPIVSGVVGKAPIMAPKKSGHYVLKTTNAQSGETATLNVFVMTSLEKVDKTGKLNGYTIGKYPDKPLKNNPIYLPPPGLIEVSPEQTDVRLSPNFTLGQFLSKQQQGFPKYVHLRAGLLLKLEKILHTLNDEGHAVEGLTIMSGYRTPFYNKAIGNVQYSRHVWGGAADFYIDQSPKDGVMDDLNKDGVVNREDAVWLANFISNMSKQGAFGPRVGGLGIYGANAAHGPFVHVDVRGTLARW